jgi:peptidoglycan/xylan/chitin deacetylase (PgdA/CDA1 family)
MYHRIAEPVSDVWEITVSADRFEQHLQVLQKMGNVVTLQQLADQIISNKLNRNTIAITFDDGYIDNFTVAKPLLEKYQLPATFFIASGNVGSDKEFWWDELEYIFLFSPLLPASLSIYISETQITLALKEEASLTEELKRKHSLWKACTEEPPTLRAKLFYKIWEQLRPLRFDLQQQYLQQIRTWANVPESTRPAYRMMNTAELKQMAVNPLFTIGVHTVTHPALAHQSILYQKTELLENRKFLAELTNHEVKLLAYPYGNYNSDTMTIVSDAQFNAAFTTEEKTIKSGSARYRLGRFQAKM